MRLSKYPPIFALFSLAFVLGTPANAQPQNAPWVEMQTTSAMVGVGGQSGDGILRLPNLGTNCAYPFNVNGFGAGVHVGVSTISATGVVQNMTHIGQLAGDYNATQGEATVVAGAGATSMKNRANNIVINLQSQTKGIALGFGAQGMSISMAKLVTRAPRVDVLEFGFNKVWLSAAARTKLAEVTNAWKCRYVSIELVGHADTIGKEDANLELAQKRADAVRDFLVGEGFVPTRIMTRSVGASESMVKTGPGVRSRSNRIVVLSVKPM
jgi:outer membrane protein OmpA-like peptidoglycan-associated protein